MTDDEIRELVVHYIRATEEQRQIAEDMKLTKRMTKLFAISIYALCGLMSCYIIWLLSFLALGK